MGCFYCRKAKLGIQRLSYPANSKKDRISVFDVGSGRVNISDFLSGVIYHLLVLKGL